MDEQQANAGFFARIAQRWKAVPVEKKTRIRWLGWGAAAVIAIYVAIRIVF